LKKRLKIVFMRTPDFAVPVLEGILSSDEEVCLVITQPDRPVGRGLKSMSSQVKKKALSLGLEVDTPDKIKASAFISKLKDLAPDIIIVAAYGKILPRAILDIPKLYPINVHASLLPKYRGAAPINWAIIRGEKETGITIMKMNEKMDEGDIMMKEKTSIEEDDDAETLHDRLAKLGGKLIREALLKIKSGNATFTEQSQLEATYAPMLKKEDGLINWRQESGAIHSFVRGMNPWPGAYTYLNAKLIKIFRTRMSAFVNRSKLDRSRPGQITDIFKDSIAVRTLDGSILIEELQKESKKRMSASDFIQGSGLKADDIFENA